MAGMVAATAELVVRSGAWPAMAGSGGPGRLDPNDPAGALIFDTARGELHGDALARFFASELDELDWLADYLMDTSALHNEQEGGPCFDVEAEPEEEYERKALTTTDTDSGWDIT